MSPPSDLKTSEGRSYVFSHCSIYTYKFIIYSESWEESKVGKRKEKSWRLLVSLGQTSLCKRYLIRELNNTRNVRGRPCGEEHAVQREQHMQRPWGQRHDCLMNARGPISLAGVEWARGR